MTDTYLGSPYMSYGGDDSMGGNDASGGIFGGNSVFGGDPCFAQNVLIGLIVLYMLYTFVYLPSQAKSTEGFSVKDTYQNFSNKVSDMLR